MFYAVFARVCSTWSPFWLFNRVLQCLCSLLQEVNPKVHIHGLKSNLCPSFKVIGARSATLAWLKKRNKHTNKQNNSAFNMLSNSPSCACLLTLLLYFPAPMVPLSISIPLGNARESPAHLTKFWRVCCFSLSTCCNGSNLINLFFGF